MNNNELNTPAEDTKKSGFALAQTKAAAAKLKPKSRGDWIVIVIAFLITVGSIVLSVYLISNAKDAGAEALRAKFDEAVSENRAKVYNDFYKTAYDYSEKRNHVANKVLISVGDLRETAELEVLEVSAADVKEYTFNNEFTKSSEIVSALFGRDVKSEGVAWLEGKSSGVFSIDLNASEIVIDNDNAYVLIRVPSPTLKFTSTEFEVKHFNNGTILNKLFDGNTKIGLEAAMNDVADMTVHLHDKLNDNHNYRDAARSSAETLIVNLVKGVNPDIPDLTVEVKFFS